MPPHFFISPFYRCSRSRRRHRLFAVLSGLCLLAALAAAALVVSPRPADASWLEKAQQWLGGGGGETSGSADLSEPDIVAGLKEVLQVGTQTVVAKLGKPDGFNADPAVHIPLPEKLRSVRNVLDRVGLAFWLDDLETELNRAAEQAVPEAKRLFWQAIGEMTVTDAMSIYQGPPDAATRYFQERMTPELARTFKPKVEESLDKGGRSQHFNI